LHYHLTSTIRYRQQIANEISASSRFRVFQQNRPQAVVVARLFNSLFWSRGPFLRYRAAPARRRRTSKPRIRTAEGDIQHTALRRHRITGPIRLHELEDSGGTELVPCVNQAAAFARISFSWRRRLFSHRSRRNPSRSALVTPSSRRPSSKSAWRTQLWIVVPRVHIRATAIPVTAQRAPA
jgi:hypothetical protein